MQNNRVKIGARILSNQALDKLLPSNRNIMEQLSYIRKVARTERADPKNIDSNKGFWDREFDRHFNNIFSILGGRGSGKTSVLLTMKYKIQHNLAGTDIILPLIVPEKMGNVSDVLGCLLGLLGDIVTEYEEVIFEINKIKYEKKQIFKDYFQDCRKREDNPLREKYNELLKQYRYTKTDYRDILIKEYVGFNDYIDNAKNILDSDQKLVVKFEEFVEELLKVKREANDNNKDEPLLFIFFDDVDLSTERCVEVLSVILRYLSHSNIVVFVAGNYLTFSEVLTINALKKDDILNTLMEKVFYSDRVNEQKKALDIRKELTQDLLKKAMPPAYRYNMPLMDEKAKADFDYSSENENLSNELDKDVLNESVHNSNEYPKLFELIVKNFIHKDYNSKDYQKNLFKDNFLHYKNELLYDYYRVVDNTPRGAMNVYYFLHSIQNDIINNENSKCLRLRRFLDIIVKSSTVLSKYENVIYKIIDIKDTYEDTFIDYKYIESMLETQEINRAQRNDRLSESKNESKLMPVDDIATIFILAHFIENIKLVETEVADRKIKPHGTDVLCKILNSQNKNFSLYPKISDVKMLLKMHEQISESISETNIRNLSQYSGKDYFLGKYFEVLDKVKGNALSKWFRTIYLKDKDRNWVDEKINVIMKHGGGFIIILKENIENVYNLAKKIYLGEERLKEITEDLKKINEHSIKEYSDESIKQIICIREEIKQQYVKCGILSEQDLKNSNFEEVLIEYYEDRLLDFETRIKRANKIFRLNTEIKSAYQNILDIWDSYRFREKIEDDFVIKYKELFLNNNYIFEETFDSFQDDVENVLKKGARYYPPAFMEAVVLFNRELKRIEPELPDEKYKELGIDICELKEIIVYYVKVKTALEIKARENLPNSKETFYNMFKRLKEELIKTESYLMGFKEHIIEKEYESRKANI